MRCVLFFKQKTANEMRISDWSSVVCTSNLMEHTADGSLPQTLSPTDSERQWAALAHLSALVLALMTSWIAGAAGVLAAVVVYMIKRDDSPFASGHARE